MLGGLARWLRAAGYDASWSSHVDDRMLVRLAHAQGRTLLSSDHEVFLFALVRDGIVPSLWIPHRLRVQEQLAHVLKEFSLPLCEPRCMSCGGELAEIPKQAAAPRIPPRTFAWLNQFWECTRCGRLFWQGTHWQRIRTNLEHAKAQASKGP